MPDWIIALILGLIEGLTEFIPVSSTGHLLLAKEAMELDDPRWNSFIVMIQLGAILAVVALYFGRLWEVVRTLPSSGDSRRFALSVLVAFIPSAILGLAFYGFIKTPRTRRRPSGSCSRRCRCSCCCRRFCDGASVSPPPSR